MKTGSEMVWEVYSDWSGMWGADEGGAALAASIETERRELSNYGPWPVFPEAEQDHMVDLAPWNFWAFLEMVETKLSS